MSSLQGLQGFMAVIAIILLISLVMSIRIGRKQRKYGNEKGNPAVYKHPVLKNPIFWAYILFPVLIAICAAIWLGIFE
jgi:hypothetical protein